MGLDYVELIMEVEDQFAIDIPDEEAQQFTTVGALISYVTGRVHAARSNAAGACPTARTFYTVRSKLLTAVPLSRHQIRPASRFDSLLPPEKRRQVWRQLKRVGLRPPPLELSRAAIWSMFAGLLMVVATDILWLKTGLWWCFLLPVGFVIFTVAQLFATQLPASCATLRDVVIRTTVPSSMSDDEIARKIRLMVSEYIAVPPDQIRDDSRMVDLGF